MISYDFNRFQWQIVLAKLGRLTVGRFFSASFEVPEFYATLLKSFRAAIPTEPATECH
jgi:non-canonical (house-cleaning) NTP pyrophosphatase